MKDDMDKTLYEQRTLMYLDFANQDFFSSKEAILAEVERELLKATIDSIDYVDPNNKDTNTALENLDAEDATVAGISSETHILSTNTETDQSKRENNAVQKWIRA